MRNVRFLSVHPVLKACLLTVIIGVTAVENIRAGCGTAPIEIVSVAAEKDKCGFTPCINDSLPIMKYYLVSTLVDWGWIAPNDDFGIVKRLTVQTTDPTNCVTTTVFSGTARYIYGNYDGMGNDDVKNASITDSATGEWDDYSLPHKIDTEYVTIGGNYSPIAEDIPICTPTTDSRYSCSHAAGAWTDYAEAHFFDAELSELFTDKMMREMMLDKLPPLPDWDHVNGGNAHYSISDSHAHCDGSRMKYRFFLCGENSAQKDQVYKLEWLQTTTFPGTNNAPVIDHMSLTVKADGNPEGMYVYPDPPGIDVPEAPCTITESGADVTPIPGGGGDGPGSGGKK